MAKQIEDTNTMELLPVPKKRGRPATGNAMTAAERQRRKRERDKAAVWTTNAEIDAGLDPENMTTTGLIEQLAACVRYGTPTVAKALAAELIRRAKENQDSRDGNG